MHVASSRRHTYALLLWNDQHMASAFAHYTQLTHVVLSMVSSIAPFQLLIVELHEDGSLGACNMQPAWLAWQRSSYHHRECKLGELLHDTAWHASEYSRTSGNC